MVFLIVLQWIYKIFFLSCVCETLTFHTKKLSPLGASSSLWPKRQTPTSHADPLESMHRSKHGPRIRSPNIYTNGMLPYSSDSFRMICIYISTMPQTCIGNLLGLYLRTSPRRGRTSPKSCPFALRHSASEEADPWEQDLGPMLL